MSLLDELFKLYGYCCDHEGLCMHPTPLPCLSRRVACGCYVPCVWNIAAARNTAVAGLLCSFTLRGKVSKAHSSRRAAKAYPVAAYLRTQPCVCNVPSARNIAAFPTGEALAASALAAFGIAQAAYAKQGIAQAAYAKQGLLAMYQPQSLSLRLLKPRLLAMFSIRSVRIQLQSLSKQLLRDTFTLLSKVSKQLRDKSNSCIVVTDLGSINYFNESSVHLAFLMSHVFARSSSTHSSSETLSGDLANKLSHIKHKKPTSNKELGAYLAGLFEGAGHISNIPQIVIVFHQKDKESAITLCDSFKHGEVKPLKNKKAIVWVISNKPGIIKFLNLVNGFIRTPYKLNQILVNAGPCLPSNFQKKVDSSHLLKSWWLSGFTDADGYLYTQILSNRKPSDTVRIQLKFSLKDRIVLDQLASTFRGTVGIRKHASGAISYCWSSGTNKNAFNVYAYFHKYSLQSKKWLEFLYWRKALRLVFENKPLMSSHLTQIKTYKLSMEKLRV